jgi:hypothetical protein
MRLAELGERLAARWRRRVPAPKAAWLPQIVGATGGDPARREAAGTAPTWTEARLAVAEGLWGQGFLMPGGAEEILRLAVPLGLSTASSLVLVGVGSGGPAIRLAGELGVWVHGYDPDPLLAACAAERIHRAGGQVAKRATAETCDPLAPSFQRRAFHHALTVEALRLARPEDMLHALAAAIRPGGQIAMLETVAAVPLDAREPGIAAWARLEQRRLPVPSAELLSRTLGKLGFDVRVAEDVSARHMRLAVTAWQRLVSALDGKHPDPPRAAALVTEAELWLRRLRLMQAGRLQVMRWLAIGR